MTRQKISNRRQARLMRPCLLASAIGLALVAQSSHAIDLSTDEVSIRLDTTISYGSGVRVGRRDSDLIAKSHFDPTISQAPLQAQIDAQGRFSANSDDGNLNFDRGDFIFNAARGYLGAADRL